MKPYYDHGGITIYHGDCREVLPTLAPVDLVLTDPPYGLDGEDFPAVESALRDARYDSAAVILDWRNPIRGPRKVGEVVWEYGWVSGFRSLAKSGVCHTHNTIHLLGNASRMRFTDGSLLLRGPGLSSPRHTSFAKKSGHPHEKPIGLMVWLLDRMVGDTVLDPFCGSGTTLVAAQKSGRHAIGIELEEKYCEIAAERLRQEVLGL